MSRLQQLIQELCPDGVEYVRLAECCDIEDNKRKPVKSSLRIPGDTPYYGANNIQDYVKGYTHYGQYVLIAEDGSASLENYSVQYVDGFFWANNHVHVIKGRKDLDTKFLYYYLTSFNFIPFLTGGTRAKLNKRNMEKIPIPIPPLPVQQEIVRILDTFTELIKELNAELDRRRKQYEYYRNLLLTFDDARKKRLNIKWMRLGEIGRISMCKRIMKVQTTPEGEVPFYKIGTFGGIPDAYISKELYEEYKSKYPFPKKGDVLISASGTIGRTVIYDGKPAYFQDSNIIWVDNDEKIVLNKYLYYYYQLQPWKVSTGGVIKRLYNYNLEQTVIAVPPLEEQQRIVNILDRFDTLINDPITGIPAEIEAREKQFKYYLNKLLDFKEVTS
jgi:type I restriction enzyme S subunit